MTGDDLLDGLDSAVLSQHVGPQALYRHVWDVLRTAEDGALDPGPLVERTDDELARLPARVLFVEITEYDGISVQVVDQSRIPDAIAALVDGVHGVLPTDGWDLGSLQDAVTMMKLQALGSPRSAADYRAGWTRELSRWSRDETTWPTVDELEPLMGLFGRLPPSARGWDGRIDRVVCYRAP